MNRRDVFKWMAAVPLVPMAFIETPAPVIKWNPGYIDTSRPLSFAYWISVDEISGHIGHTRVFTQTVYWEEL